MKESSKIWGTKEKWILRNGRSGSAVQHEAEAEEASEVVAAPPEWDKCWNDKGCDDFGLGPLCGRRGKCGKGHGDRQEKGIRPVS